MILPVLVRMVHNVQLLGTGLTLQEGEVYEAVPAVNQPDYKLYRLYFVYCSPTAFAIHQPTNSGSILCRVGLEIELIEGGI